MSGKIANTQTMQALPKSRTGIPGMSEITGGGLPTGRPTLVTGGPGCGKTLFAMQFLANGAMLFDEPGVYVAFEESAEELAQNVASLGFDLAELVRQGKLIVEYVKIERDMIEETGEYDLDGLFIRLEYAIDKIGAKRVVLDTVEVLFSALKDHALLRSELQRLFRWLKSKGMTAVVTAERGNNSMTRFGLEEYVADCVIVLDHRVNDQISTRRLRIVKYRGSLHGTNEYPFLIGKKGISILPITSLDLDHPAPSERISTGVKELDDMLGGQGFYRGSSILLTGTSGTGKTSLGVSFVDAACRHGQRGLYFAFEESTSQILRNMRSIGIDLAPHVENGLLRFLTTRPSQYGLEMHLMTMYDLIEEFKPEVVVLDPITDFSTVANLGEIKAAVTRVIDYLKKNQVTGLLTAATSEEEHLNDSIVDISSLIDAWISLRNIERDGELQRGLIVLKSRGMAHSNQIRAFRLTDQGIRLSTLDLAGGRRGQPDPA